MKLIDIASSYKSMLILMIAYAVSIATATFVEAEYDTISVKKLFYTSWWFIAIQIAMVINFIAISIKLKLIKQRKWGILSLHCGLIIMLIGALTTHLWGSESMLFVREGETSSTALSSETYFIATVSSNEGGHEIFKKEVVFGSLYSDNISFTSQNGITISSHGYKDGMLAIKLESDSAKQIIVLEGGAYSKASAKVIEFDGSKIALKYGSVPVKLPFSITLNDFTLTRYPGSSSPSSYNSNVTIDYKNKTYTQDIYMNKIAYIGGYRVYQTSYDKDEQGTILTVNHDMAGTVITYIGYLLLALGLLASLLGKKSRFYRLNNKLKKISTTATILLLSTTLFAKSTDDLSDKLSPFKNNKEVVDAFSRLLIQNNNGRIEPLDSYAQKISRKLHHSTKILDIPASAALLGMIIEPQLWSTLPFIYIDNPQLQKELGVKDKYIAFADLFDKNGSYLLEYKVQEIYNIPSNQQNKYHKEIIKLDERANIFYSLINNRMLTLFPVENHYNGLWVSMGDELSNFTNKNDSVLVSQAIQMLVSASESRESDKALEIIKIIDTFQKSRANKEQLISSDKITTELFYNKIPIFKISGIGYLLLGFIMLVTLLRGVINGNKWYDKRLFCIVSILLSLLFIWHTFGIGLRWYISGRAPWTNSYESMIFVGWSALLMGLLFIKRSKMTFSLAAIMAGCVVMISHISLADPEITPLVPVLKSYWLMSHVATITASYGFFGVSSLLGLIVLSMIALKPKGKSMKELEELTIINEMSMTIGLVLLSIGIFLGAIWANESWGRYWGWDPKESWALITMIIYAFVVHSHFIKSMNNLFVLNLLSVYSFYSVLMTFFGVNYYLSGMHSYGQVDSISPYLFFIPTLIIVITTIAAYRKS